MAMRKISRTDTRDDTAWTKQKYQLATTCRQIALRYWKGSSPASFSKARKEGLTSDERERGSRTRRRHICYILAAQNRLEINENRENKKEWKYLSWTTTTLCRYKKTWSSETWSNTSTKIYAVLCENWLERHRTTMTWMKEVLFRTNKKNFQRVSPISETQH